MNLKDSKSEGKLTWDMASIVKKRSESRSYEKDKAQVRGTYQARDILCRVKPPKGF